MERLSLGSLIIGATLALTGCASLSGAPVTATPSVQCERSGGIWWSLEGVCEVFGIH